MREVFEWLCGGQLMLPLTIEGIVLSLDFISRSCEEPVDSQSESTSMDGENMKLKVV